MRPRRPALKRSRNGTRWARFVFRESFLTSTQVKTAAKARAAELGISLSAFVRAVLEAKRRGSLDSIK